MGDKNREIAEYYKKRKRGEHDDELLDRIVGGSRREKKAKAEERKAKREPRSQTRKQGRRKHTYTVRSGDSWFSIAGSELGDQRYAGELARLNPGFDVLNPGVELVLPEVYEDDEAPLITNEDFGKFLKIQQDLIEAGAKPSGARITDYADNAAALEEYFPGEAERARARRVLEAFERGEVEDTKQKPVALPGVSDEEIQSALEVLPEKEEELEAYFDEYLTKEEQAALSAQAERVVENLAASGYFDTLVLQDEPPPFGFTTFPVVGVTNEEGVLPDIRDWRTIERPDLPPPLVESKPLATATSEIGGFDQADVEPKNVESLSEIPYTMMNEDDLPEIPTIEISYDIIEVGGKEIKVFNPRNTWMQLDPVDMLTRAILSEQNEKVLDELKWKDVIGTGWVVINRINSAEFPSEMLDVLVERNQFIGFGGFPEDPNNPQSLLQLSNAYYVANPEGDDQKGWFADSPRVHYWTVRYIAQGILDGTISDPTFGATFYADAYVDESGHVVPYPDGQTHFGIEYLGTEFYSLAELDQFDTSPWP